MLTVKQMNEQRERWLKEHRGISPAGFNKSVELMVEQQSKNADGKLAKKQKSRRAVANWKRRNKLNG